MEEIGCHFKFEKINGDIYHNTDLLLSSGRNCLRYILREKRIKTLFLPYFLCESLSEVAELENVKIVYYHIDNNFMPIGINMDELNDDTYLYIVNYYGLFRKQIKELVNKYKFVIVDNTHDFFDKDDYNADVIYNYRKYFGIPDGACIVSKDLKFKQKYLTGKSSKKIIEMVLRDETGEYLHYPTFLEADKYFKNEGLSHMSNFTENYLRAIDYKQVLKRRLKNYRALTVLLAKYNRLDLKGFDLTYMYPLFVDGGEELRAHLKRNRIYSLKLWPNVDWNGANNAEKEKANNMVLLPIDQRYGEDEMEYIAQSVDNYYSGNKSIRKRME